MSTSLKFLLVDCGVLKQGGLKQDWSRQSGLEKGYYREKKSNLNAYLQLSAIEGTPLFIPDVNQAVCMELAT